MLVPLPSLSRRGESNYRPVALRRNTHCTSFLPVRLCCGLELGRPPPRHHDIHVTRNRSVTTLFVLTPGGDVSRTRRTVLLLQNSARAIEVALLTRPACLPASACESVRPFALLLSVSPRSQASTTFPVMALCKAEVTRHGHTRRA